ncbi:unnamed protein product [Lepidochelys kempii]
MERGLAAQAAAARSFGAQGVQTAGERTQASCPAGHRTGVTGSVGQSPRCRAALFSPSPGSLFRSQV